MKRLLPILAGLLLAVACWAPKAKPGAGAVAGTDNYLTITQVAGGPRVNVEGANFHVVGTTLLDSTLAVTGTSTFTGTVTLPSGTILTAPAISAPTITGIMSNTPQTFTIADDAAGTSPAGTLTPTSSVVLATCADSDNCTCVMGESTAVSGQIVTIVNMGTPTIAFADSAGVSETTGTITLGQYDSLRFVYATDRWVELSTSNN